jgi:DNA polymerase/3'-5' exonuclease PolX
LAPSCERVAIAGSIRRQCGEVKDVELVVIPKFVFRTETVPPADLFSKEMVREVKVSLLFEALGSVPNLTWIKPGTKEIIEWPLKPDAKYYRGYIPSKNLKVDIFLATPENWGLIYTIRTGPEHFSHKALALKWCRLGYHSVKGMLTKKGIQVPVREEMDLFNLLKLPFIEPRLRN